MRNIPSQRIWAPLRWYLLDLENWLQMLLPRHLFKAPGTNKMVEPELAGGSLNRGPRRGADV
jgi:hypothetical protein